MKFMDHIEKPVDGLTMLRFLGLFMVVFGVMGMSVYVFPYTSTMQVRMEFAASVAGIWAGACMVLLRWPSSFLTALWMGFMLAVWQFKYGALPF